MRVRTQLLTLIAISSLLFSLQGCGKFKKSGGAIATSDVKSSSTTSSTTPCGPVHKMGDLKPTFEYYNCGPVDDLRVTAYTTNEKGESLGPTPVNRGMLSLRYTKLHNDIISHKETFGIIFMANGNSNYEVNWQWMSYQMGGAIQSRLVIQRFDGTCPKFCEQSDITDEIQFWDYAEIWQWDCEWDTWASKVACVVTKVGAPDKKYITINDPRGRYNGLRYLGVGKSAYDGHLPSYQGIVTDFKLTVFADDL
ncbi:MAG: hypothetical protein OEV92_08925 [Nitrospinota bacterium]|nr:hypothetical protein [Nitrospinota bacterium]